MLRPHVVAGVVLSAAFPSTSAAASLGADGAVGTAPEPVDPGTKDPGTYNPDQDAVNQRPDGDPWDSSGAKPPAPAPAPAPAPDTQPPPPDAPAAQPPRAEVPDPEKPDKPEKHPFSLEKELGEKKRKAYITPYGMVVTNVVYNTGSAFPSNESPIGGQRGSLVDGGLETDGAFLVTARQSRIGLKGGIQITDRVDATGKIEADFFGLHEDAGPGGPPQTGLRLRLAYMEVGDDRFRFIAGQNWSVITPRMPTSLSHMVIALHSFSGNVWNRLPQVAGVIRQPIETKKGGLEDLAFKAQFSVARNVSHDGFGSQDCPPEGTSNDPNTLPYNPPPSCRIVRFDKLDPGIWSGLPLGQARLAIESKQFSFGIAGQGGAEKFARAELDADGNAVGVGQLVETWMVSADLQVKLKWFWFNGQGYFGYNINGMFSRQGVRGTASDVTDPNDPLFGETVDYDSLPGFGGWAEIGFNLGTDKVKLVASGGADVGDKDGDITGDGIGVATNGVWLNVGAFGGLIYAPHPNFDMSAEYLRSMTYWDVPAGTATSLAEGANDSISANFRLKF